MKKINFFIVFLFLTYGLFGQTQKKSGNEFDRKGKFMAGLAFDALKTDFKTRIGNKIQGGLEVNYFLSNQFSVTAGAEVWVDTTLIYSGVAGIRFYPVRKFFLRARGLIGVEEIAAGAGFNVFLDEKWTSEGIIDVYTSKHVAVRIGITYLITKRRLRNQ